MEIAERTGYTVVQVSRLRRRFAEHGVCRTARSPAVGAAADHHRAERAQIVALTLKPPAAGLHPLVHAGSRPGGRRLPRDGASPLARARPAAAPGSTFKFTTDPEAEDKIYDVVGCT